jgi:hypothetical protein
MGEPRFSIVVPTRNRAQTLRHTLRTCLAQDFEDFEILVSDNGSDETAKAVTDELASGRIRYVRTSKPLAMSDNWDFALSHVRGELVTFLGDDDGLLFGALSTADRLLRELRLPALRWERVGYAWPNVETGGAANRLVLPLARGVEVVASREIASWVANCRVDFTLLPSPYHGVVRRDLLEALRAKAGRVFGGSSPDIFTGFALAQLMPRYACLAAPTAIAGTSAASNGAGNLQLAGDHPSAREFHSLNTQAGLDCHPRAPDLPILPAVLADMYLRADDVCGDRRAALLDRKALSRNCIRALRWQTPEQWSEGVAAIRRSLCDSPSLERWFDREIGALPPTRFPEAPFFPSLGFDGRRLVVDASRFDVVDVYGAAQLVDDLLGSAPDRVGPMGIQRLSPWRRVRSAARILLKGR